MKREIEFRGKRKDNNEWIYGDLYQEKKPYTKTNEIKEMMIVEYRPDLCLVSGAPNNNHWWREIIPETIGQYGNIKTDKGRKIYEGDVCFEEVEGDTGDKRIYYVFTFINEWNMFAWLSIDEHKNYKDYGVGYLYQTDWYSGTEPLQYAGNIHDNPELLNK